MAWILTLAAVNDFDRIAADGALRFGFVQSERYELELVEMLDKLAAMPQLAPERQALNTLIRLMPCGSHNIAYFIKNEDVIVLRVLHGLQNWFDLL